MKNAFFYFLIFPFYGLIQAIRNYKLPWAQNMLWLFVVFYGYTMHRPVEMDSSRYAAKLEMLSEAPRTWDSFVASFYSIDERGQGSVDIYEPIMVNFVSLFTSNANVLFAFFAIVYGFFYSRNMWFIIEEIKKIKTPLKNFWFLFFSFACIIGFWQLNGVRMWTAAQVYVYGVFMILFKEKKSGYLFVISSVLIHFSFGLAAGIFLLFKFFKPPVKLVYIIFILSFFIATFNVTFITNAVQSLVPEFFLPRINNYISDEYKEVHHNIKDTAVWYIKYFKFILNYSIATLITIINFSKHFKIKEDKPFYNLYYYSLIFMIFGNILFVLPSGSRYLSIAQYLALGTVTLYFIRFENFKYKKAVLFLSPFLLFFIIVSIRISFDTMSIMTIFTNPILATIIDTPVPLIDILK